MGDFSDGGNNNWGAGGEPRKLMENLEETGTLDPKVQEQLGRVFRTYCDDLIHQPIPAKFVVLLAKLEAKQRERK